MPAPVPIRIDYGSPTLYGSLAAQAGSAQARRRSEEQAYRMQLQQMAQDSAFMRDEQARRFAPQTYRQTSPTMLADASGYAPRPQTFTNPMPQNDIQRLVMERQQQHGAPGFIAGASGLQQRAAGVGVPNTLRSTPVQMVPSEGPYGQQNQRQPSTIHERGTGTTFTRFPEGTTTITGAASDPNGAQMLREMDPRFQQSQQQMVTPQVRQQLDMVRAMQGSIPADQYNSLMVAAQTGQLKTGALVDDLRQSVPAIGAAHQTSSQKQADRAQAGVQLFHALRTMAPEDQAAYAISQQWVKPEQPSDAELYATGQEQATMRADREQRNRDLVHRAIQSREVIADQLAQFHTGDMPMTDSPAQSSMAAPAAPSVGDIVDGMKFLGGDPADPASWGNN